MPETEVVIAEAKKLKEGSSQKGPWKLYSIVDGNGSRFSSFNDAHFELAQTLIGKRAKITYDENEKGKTVKELAGPLDNNGPDAEPKLGTGEYVRGQTAPNDKRSIAASVALKAAVDTLNHTIKTDSTPKSASERIIPLADEYFLWLSGKAGVQQESDVPW